MGLEQIGLEGVFKTEAFTSGLSKYTSGLTSAGSLTKSVAGGLGSILSTGLTVAAGAFAAVATAAVVAGAAIAGAISKIVFDSANLADQLATMAGQTGISITRLQELAYAGTLLDVDLETMTSAQKFLTKAMYAGRDGTGEQADAFKALGIKIVDAKGHLLDSSVIFGKTIDALGKMTNETERDAMAMKLMGRNAMELNPLIKAGSKTLAEYSAEAHTMGAVVSEEGILALDQFKDRFDALKLSFKGIAAQAAIYFLPFFADIEDAVRGMVADFVATGDIGVLADDIAETLDRIMTNFTKSTPKVLKSVTKMITNISKLLVAKLPIFIKNGGEMLTALLKGLAENIPDIFRAGLDVMATIYDALSKAMPSILQAGGEVIDALGKGILDALKTLPSISTILSFLFNTAVNLSSQVLAWAKSIDWKTFSDQIAADIAAIDWAKYGAQFHTMVINLATAVGNIISTTDWKALGISIGTGFSDFVISALSPGQNLETLRATWQTSLDEVASTITVHGWFAVGKEIWKEIWAGFQADLPHTWEEFWGPDMGGFNASIHAWWDSVGKMFQEVDWGQVGTAIGQGILNGLSAMWTKISIWFFTQYNNLMHSLGQPGIPDWWSKTPLLPQGTGTPPSTIPTIPLIPPKIPIIPTVPVSPTNPLLNNRYNMGMGGGNSTVTNNVTVNNPSAEPASTSVDKTLRKLSYLGAI